MAPGWVCPDSFWLGLPRTVYYDSFAQVSPSCQHSNNVFTNSLWGVGVSGGILTITILFIFSVSSCVKHEDGWPFSTPRACR